MAVPSKPYTTTAQVAMLIPVLLNNATDFSTTTTPKKAQVEQYITWVSNQIDMQFQQAGYIMPFQSLDDETWPEHQTYYLQLIAALGSAALTGGHVLKPAPAISTGRGVSTGNIYQDLYNQELKKVYSNGSGYGINSETSSIRFRCKAYSGSVAEKSVREPTGPTLDYIEGKMSPEDFLMFSDYTQLRNNISNYMIINYDGVTPLNWNDFHGLVNNRMGGYSYGS